MMCKEATNKPGSRQLCRNCCELDSQFQTQTVIERLAALGASSEAVQELVDNIQKSF